MERASREPNPTTQAGQTFELASLLERIEALERALTGTTTGHEAAGEPLPEEPQDALRAELGETRAALAAARAELAALRETDASLRRSLAAEEEQARRFREGLGAAESALASREREISALREALAGARRAAPAPDELPALEVPAEAAPEAPGPADLDAAAHPPADASPPSVAEPRDLPPIHRYWRRTQIASKLDLPGIESTEDFFLQYLVEACRRDPARTQRIVSLGTGLRDLEVVLAHRARRAGLQNFEIHCVSPGPSRVEHPAARRVEPEVAAHLCAVQSSAADWPAQPGAALCLANQALHELPDAPRWLEKIREALGADGVFAVSAPIGRLRHSDSELAREIALQIWRLMPDRYRGPATELPFAAAEAPPQPDPTARAAALLPQLMQLFHFEVFAPFGHVVNAFVGPEIGAAFDPQSERDRRFIDQVAALDDAKIDAGLIPPTHMLAALRTRPVEHVIYHRHWTPEFCLAGGDLARPRAEAPLAAG